MGLTNQATGLSGLLRELPDSLGDKADALIALAGNPNTGKSTVFNGLTGLNQHTGNWPGKTVVLAKGAYRYRKKEITLVDLPGAYSLLANSADEQVARDFIFFGNPDVIVVVTDATCLERNLNLVLQVLEITPRVILCVNLIDQAKQKGFNINFKKLEQILGIPVVPAVARDKKGLEELKEAIHLMVFGQYQSQPKTLIYDEALEQGISQVQQELDKLFHKKMNSRWIALRLLDGEMAIVEQLLEMMRRMEEPTKKEVRLREEIGVDVGFKQGV